MPLNISTMAEASHQILCYINGQLTIPERGVVRVMWPILELYTP